MRKIVICVLALAAFVLSSVTAFAAAGKVEKYGDEYTVIGANWVSEEDGVTESSWISIQIDGSKVEGRHSHIMARSIYGMMVNTSATGNSSLRLPAGASGAWRTLRWKPSIWFWMT